jgi:hypothetical protein
VKIKDLDAQNIKELANILKTNKSLEFQCNNLYYQIFESSELGYVINLYSSNEKDANGDYLDCNLIDGGLCTGSAKDSVEFLLN